MHIHPSELTQIQRPKLLMSTAKALIEKKKFLGKKPKEISEIELQKLLEAEAQMEYNRKEDVARYHVDRHIELLAGLIEQVYYAQKHYAYG